jgi:hypothetical protein
MYLTYVIDLKFKGLNVETDLSINFRNLHNAVLLDYTTFNKTGNVLQCNTQARSRNHYCRDAIRVTYSECAFVAVGIGHATRMRYTLCCGHILRTFERDVIKRYIDLRVKYPLFLSVFN